MAVLLPVAGIDWRTLSVDGTGVAISGSNPLPVTTTGGSGTVSTVNSTTTPLAGGATFTGTAEDVSNYAAIVVTVFSNVASAANSWLLEFSPDGTNWDTPDPYDYSGALLSTGTAQFTAPKGKFFRVVYVNGATPQASFRLQTVYHAQPVLQPMFVYNSATGQYHAVRSVASLTQNFTGGTQPAYVVAMRNAAGNHDIALTAKAANTNTDGVGLPAAGVMGTSDAGTTWKALLTNTDGSLPVGGFTPAAPTCTFTRGANATPYTIGDEVGTASTAPTTVAVGRVNGGTGVIQGAQVVYSSYAATVPQLVVVLFSATVTLAGDNAQLALSDTDAAKVIGVIPLSASQSGQYSAGAPVAAGNTIFTGVPTAPIHFTCGGSEQTLYAALITLNAWTPVANSETLSVRLQVEGN